MAMASDCARAQGQDPLARGNQVLTSVATGRWRLSVSCRIWALPHTFRLPRALASTRQMGPFLVMNIHRKEYSEVLIHDLENVRHTSVLAKMFHVIACILTHKWAFGGSLLARFGVIFFFFFSWIFESK